MSYTLPQPLDENGGGGSEGNVSDLERDMELAFGEQEELSATSPSSPRPRRSAEPSHSQIDQDYGQEQEEGAVDEMRQEVVEEEDNNDNGEREQQGGKRQHQDEEISSGIHHSESSGHSRHDTNDEDNENLRPAKRQKLPSVPIIKALTPPREHSSTLCPTPPSTTQPEIDESPPQADHRHLSTSVDNEQHYTPPTSRSPSVRVESAPVAEYREWPFQGFLKRITISNQTTYNLEFTLPRIPEHLNLSLHSGVLAAGSKESSAEATVSHQTVTSRKPGKELPKEQESLLAKMVDEDRTWTEIGRHFPGHTLQSLKENFFTKQGGKPRKRGRKPGVKGRGA